MFRVYWRYLTWDHIFWSDSNISWNGLGRSDSGFGRYALIFFYPDIRMFWCVAWEIFSLKENFVWKVVYHGSYKNTLWSGHGFNLYHHQIGDRLKPRWNMCLFIKLPILLYGKCSARVSSCFGPLHACTFYTEYYVDGHDCCFGI